MRKREAAALAALGFILLVTIAGWAAALWPLPAATPGWVVRARAAGFGSTGGGMPNRGGWILLIGSTFGMLAALLIVWGGAVRGGLAALLRRRGGRAVLGGGLAVMVVSLGAAYVRVVTAYGLGAVEEASAFSATATAPRATRIDRAAPELALLDQHGDTLRLERFRGRPVLLTFAYGECETGCRVIVHNVLEARKRLSGLDPAVVVITLDPWRDTPRRLPQIARSWGLPADAHLLGGEVERVEATLDAWRVARIRDPESGGFAHPSLVYVLDAGGRIVFAVTGNRDHIVQAARRL